MKKYILVIIMLVGVLFLGGCANKDAAKFKELSKMLKVFDWDGMEALLGN